VGYGGFLFPFEISGGYFGLLQMGIPLEAYETCNSAQEKGTGWRRLRSNELFCRAAQQIGAVGPDLAAA
jgi:hypothetical protein